MAWEQMDSKDRSREIENCDTEQQNDVTIKTTVFRGALFPSGLGWGGQRERQRQTERDRDSDRDRQTEKERHRVTERHKERQKVTESDKKADR